jgi:hypothetical protein
MTYQQPEDQRRRGPIQPPATPPQWGAPPQGPQPWVPLEQRAPYGQPQPGWTQPPGWQPQPGWPPQQQYQPPQYQPPGPPQRRKHTGLKVMAGIGGGLVALIVIVAVASSGKPTTTTPTTTTPAAAGQAAASPSHSAVTAKAVTVATFSGSGTQKTAQFAVTDNWKLAYSFDCSGFGQKGNFQVFEDGGGDLTGVIINDLAMSKSATSWAYGDAGKHYLEVNSECSWKVTVIDEGN